ncbi:hypothetical protein Hanom_Chr09g00839691 [Helianthus anomalus]
MRLLRRCSSFSDSSMFITWLDIGAGTAESDEMLDRFFKVTFPITIFVDVPFSLQIYWMSFKGIYNLLI